MLPLPDPPLDDGVVRLRPWRVDDAPALAAAWGDPDVQRWTAVPPPERRSVADAAGWIAGEATRREQGVALDLVVVAAGGDAGGEATDDGPVIGEVGLVPAVGSAALVSIGWWVAADARRRGVASRAVRLLARWAERRLGVEVVAEIDPANMVSLRVAENAGIRLRLRP